MGIVFLTERLVKGYCFSPLDVCIVQFKCDFVGRRFCFDSKDNNIAVSLFSFVLTINIAPYMICLYIKSGYHLIANSVRLNCMYYDLCKKNVYPIFLYTVVVNAHIFYHDFE